MGKSLFPYGLAILTRRPLVGRTPTRRSLLRSTCMHDLGIMGR